MPLEELQAKDKKPKKYLEGVHFDFEGAEVSYTSGAGAASLLNEPYLLKALEDSSEELSEDESELLKKLTSSTTTLVDGSGEDNLNLNKGDDDMSAEEKAEVIALKKELATLKAKDLLGKYSFDQETGDGIASALASLEEAEQNGVLKALEFLVDCGEYGVAKAASEVVVDKEPENTLKKELDSEEGSEDQDEPVTLSRSEVIKQKTQDLRGGK